MEVNIKVMGLWYMTLCCLVDRYYWLLTKNAMTLEEEDTQAVVRQKPLLSRKTRIPIKKNITFTSVMCELTLLLSFVANSQCQSFSQH